jgi:hypothetical protein
MMRDGIETGGSEMVNQKVSSPGPRPSSPVRDDYEVTKAADDLRFDLTRLIYYHDDARQFNSFMDNAITLASFLSGSAVAVAFVSEQLKGFAPYLGLLIAVIQAFDFVVKFESKTNFHASEKERYNALLTKLYENAGFLDNTVDIEIIRKLDIEKRLNYERSADKYTPFWCVDAIAWNAAYAQLADAGEFDEKVLYPISWIERRVRHFVRFTPAYFRIKKVWNQRIESGRWGRWYLIGTAALIDSIGVAVAALIWQYYLSSAEISFWIRSAITIIGSAVIFGLWYDGFARLSHALRIISRGAATSTRISS